MSTKTRLQYHKSRYSGGQIIAASRIVYQIKQTNVWKVQSEKQDDKLYDVTIYDDAIKCNCKDLNYVKIIARLQQIHFNDLITTAYF